MEKKIYDLETSYIEDTGSQVIGLVWSLSCLGLGLDLVLSCLIWFYLVLVLVLS